MEVEHAVKVFSLDQNLESNIKGMTDEGWLLLPGIAPVAIYHVVRMKGVTQQDNGQQGIAKVSIDETKVKILRNGQMIDG